MTEKAEKELENLLEIENLAKLHQETFENIYNFAFKQQNGWTNSSDSKPNPELFNQTEQILQPLFSSWKEKYNLIRQAILEEKVPYCKNVKSFVWEKREKNREIYYISHGEDLEHSAIHYYLQIRKPRVQVKSYASTLLYPETKSFWEENFNFSASFNDGIHIRGISFKIEEQSGSLVNPEHSEDKLDINLEETILPINGNSYYYTPMPHLERSVSFSVWRPSLSYLPQSRRLVDKLSFYQLLSKDQYHKMFI